VLRKAGGRDAVSHSVRGRPTRVQIQLRIGSDDDGVLSDNVIAGFDKGDDRLEEIGLSLDEAKAALAGFGAEIVPGTDLALCARAQATFREIGMPRLVMRLITAQAIRASTFWADRVRARRLRPTKTLYR